MGMIISLQEELWQNSTKTNEDLEYLVFSRKRERNSTKEEKTKQF
jgi:hypothetical protein